MHGTMTAIARSLAHFPAQSRWMAVGRTVIALGQLSALLFTPTDKFFVPVEGISKDSCESWRAGTAYCIAGDGSTLFPTIVVAIILALVVIGLLPRFTGILHYWATLSFSTAISLPDGGEAAAQVVTFWIAVVLLADARRNHWSAPSAVDVGPLTAVAWAGQVGLRLQVAYIYLNASLAKLNVEEWRDGSAVYYVVRGEYFGTGEHLEGLVHGLTSVPVVALGLAWGAMATEFAIAALLVMRPARRRAALGLSVALHVGIIAVMGLWSFALIMMGAVAVCLTSTARSEVTERPAPDGRQSVGSRDQIGDDLLPVRP